MMGRSKLAAVVAAFTLATSCSGNPKPNPQPTPSPTPTPTPTPIPTPSPDPTACDPGTPEASVFLLEARDTANPKRKFVSLTVKVNDREYCAAHNEDPRAQVVCPFWPEGHPKRADCERRHGFPTWFNATPREDNVFSADADLSDGPVVVRACLMSACSDPTNLLTCDPLKCSKPLELE